MSVVPDKIVCNLGLRADTIQGIIDRVEQIKILEPKVVYLMSGINDAATYSLDEFKERYAVLLESIRYESPEIELVCQTLLPPNDMDFYKLL